MKAHLTVRSGSEAGRRYVLRAGQRFVIGRGRDVTIRVDDGVVSRRHAELFLEASGLSITDLGSRNGTFLDGKRLQANEPVFACPEDVLQLGDQLFEIKLVGLDNKTRNELEKTARFLRPNLPPAEFEVLGEIGRGATGVVYAARQKLLLRNVAVKLPRADVEDQELARVRLVREGQLASRVRSPYVVELHDVRLVGKHVYLIMELVNGISGKDRVFSGPLPIEEALRIGEHTANALAAAHQVGVVHRDVKPSNILLSPEGIAKLSDFGIAKGIGEGDRDEEALTPSNEGLGTMAFVSPEQATSARDVGPASDLYGLGATLFNLISGEPLHLARTADDLVAFFAGPVPSLSERAPSCPPPVAELVESLLAFDPHKRPRDADLVALQLEHLRRQAYGSSRHRHKQRLSQTEEYSIDETEGGLGPPPTWGGS